MPDPTTSKRKDRFLTHTAGDMIEGALVMPLLALVTLALVNLALAGYASVTASHAAAYGARLGSVAQVNPVGMAYSSALGMAEETGVGDYAVRAWGSVAPGGTVSVEVWWEVPNLFGRLMPIFGQYNEPLQGTAVATFRKEGW